MPRAPPCPWACCSGCSSSPFAVKLPTWPLHTWLPDAHTDAPHGGQRNASRSDAEDGRIRLATHQRGDVPGTAANLRAAGGNPWRHQRALRGRSYVAANGPETSYCLFQRESHGTRAHRRWLGGRGRWGVNRRRPGGGGDAALHPRHDYTGCCSSQWESCTTKHTRVKFPTWVGSPIVCQSWRRRSCWPALPHWDCRR